MVDVQSQVFSSALYWSASTSFAVFGIGLLCSLQGFRFSRFLLGAFAGLAGFFGGAVAASVLALPPSVVGIATGAVVGLSCLGSMRVSIVLNSIVTFGFMAHYGAARLELLSTTAYSVALAGAVIGCCLPYMLRRSMPLILTTIQGALVCMVGFVGVAANFLPGVASTFVIWANDVSLMVPLLLGMLIVLGYSVQSNTNQGDIMTGGVAEEA